MAQNILSRITDKKSRLCVGLMSGTSMDGVDAALVRITNSGLDSEIELIGRINYPYPPGLKDHLLYSISRRKIPLSEFGGINILIGEIFADAVIELLKTCKAPAEEVDLVGSHGQTLWHNPVPEEFFGHAIRSTLQLGEPSVIQARTGIVTVADFRMKDVALGGEGAPLIPYFDFLFYRSDTENRGLLNIGGIANITVLPANAEIEDVFAFDTGPGNMLIDQLAEKLYNISYDKDGKLASQAEYDELVLSVLMDLPYLKLKPPKSTGRELFSKQYADKIVNWSNQIPLSPECAISTVTEFTVRTILQSYKQFIKPKRTLDKIIVSGGGVYNDELMRRLKKEFKGVEITSANSFGVPADIKEAVAFAVYANEAVMGNSINLPKVTGASRRGISGKIVL